MMKIHLYIFVLLPFVGVSQSSNSNAKAYTSEQMTIENKKNNSTRISTSFLETTILAYQNEGINKIKDFYAYINLYDSSQDNISLQSEIDKSIQNLFINSNILLKDVFGTNNNLTLSTFLMKIKKNNANVKILSFSNSNAILDSYFIFNYKLQVRVNSKIEVYDLEQKVYFFPSEKQFGNQVKKVWQLKLGETNGLQ